MIASGSLTSIAFNMGFSILRVFVLIVGLLTHPLYVNCNNFQCIQVLLSEQFVNSPCRGMDMNSLKPCLVSRAEDLQKLITAKVNQRLLLTFGHIIED